LLIIFVLVSFAALGAQAASPAGRKINARVSPPYPELARKMRVEGVVKIEAVVRPNGSVKATRVIGGNPVFVQAASDAVKQWKFESAPTETTEVVQLEVTGH